MGFLAAAVRAAAEATFSKPALIEPLEATPFHLPAIALRTEIPARTEAATIVVVTLRSFVPEPAAAKRSSSESPLFRPTPLVHSAKIAPIPEATALPTPTAELTGTIKPEPAAAPGGKSVPRPHRGRPVHPALATVKSPHRLETIAPPVRRMLLATTLVNRTLVATPPVHRRAMFAFATESMTELRAMVELRAMSEHGSAGEAVVTGTRPVPAFKSSGRFSAPMRADRAVTGASLIRTLLRAVPVGEKPAAESGKQFAQFGRTGPGGGAVRRAIAAVFFAACIAAVVARSEASVRRRAAFGVVPVRFIPVRAPAARSEIACHRPPRRSAAVPGVRPEASPARPVAESPAEPAGAGGRTGAARAAAHESAATTAERRPRCGSGLGSALTRLRGGRLVVGVVRGRAGARRHCCQ